MSTEQNGAGEGEPKKHPKVHKIFVNTREKEVTTDVLTFDEVVMLAFGTVALEGEMLPLVSL